MFRKQPIPQENREEEYREVSPYDLKDIYSPPEVTPYAPEFARVFLGKDFATTRFMPNEVRKNYYDLKIAVNLYLSTLNYKDFNNVENLRHILYLYYLPELAYARLKKSEQGLLVGMIGKVLRVHESKYGASMITEKEDRRLDSLIGIRR